MPSCKQRRYIAGWKGAMPTSAPCASLKRVHQLTSLVKMPHRSKSSNIEILHSFHGVYFN